jgi:Integrase core domain
VLVPFVYLVVCRLFALVLLLARGDSSKELELLILRHELSILRRQARRPQLTGSDRLLLAALSRVVPRRSWRAFLITPETLLRWHRRIVARRIIRTPVQAPNTNAYAERWVGSVRRECLDRLLNFGRRQLAHVLRVYICHFNQQRPHRALDLQPAVRRPRNRSFAHSDGLSAASEATRPPRRTHSRIRSGGVKIEVVHPTGADLVSVT